MRLINFKRIVSPFVATLFAVNVHAGVIFEKNLDNTAGAGFNSNSQAQQIAEDFVLDTKSALSRVTWYGYFQQTQQPGGSFDILFLDDVGGLPAPSATYSTTTTVLTGVSTGLGTGFGAIYEWTAELPEVHLSMGQHWISIRAVSAVAFAWAHAGSSGDDVVIVRFDDNQNWQISPSGENGRDAQAFKLEGQRIPGPAPLALVALGTAILGFRRFDRAFIKPVASSA